MGIHVTSYRVRVPAEKDRSDAHPELLVSAADPEEAKRRAWEIMKWPDSIRDASELDAIDVYVTTSSVARRRDRT